MPGTGNTGLLHDNVQKAGDLAAFACLGVVGSGGMGLGRRGSFGYLCIETAFQFADFPLKTLHVFLQIRFTLDGAVMEGSPHRASPLPFPIQNRRRRRTDAEPGPRCRRPRRRTDADSAPVPPARRRFCSLTEGVAPASFGAAPMPTPRPVRSRLRAAAAPDRRFCARTGAVLSLPTGLRLARQRR